MLLYEEGRITCECHFKIFYGVFSATNPEQLLVTRAANLPLHFYFSTWHWPSLSWLLLCTPFFIYDSVLLALVFSDFLHFPAAIGCKSASNVVTSLFFFLSTFNPHRAVSFRQLEPSLSIDSLVSPEPAKRDNTMSR